MRLCHTSPATPWSTSGSMVSRVPYSRSRWGPTSWHHDKVPHCRLIEKFKTNNVTGKLLTLIFNWLLHWTQRTVLNGESFDWSSVISGVQQGSVLDPLAFMIYIDDLDKSAVPSTVLNKLWQICRSFHYKNEKTFVTLYKQYVRPHVEYVIAAWSPWKVAGKELLEKGPKEDCPVSRPPHTGAGSRSWASCLWKTDEPYTTTSHPFKLFMAWIMYDVIYGFS